MSGEQLQVMASVPPGDVILPNGKLVTVQTFDLTSGSFVLSSDGSTLRASPAELGNAPVPFVVGDSKLVEGEQGAYAGHDLQRGQTVCDEAPTIVARLRSCDGLFSGLQAAVAGFFGLDAETQARVSSLCAKQAVCIRFESGERVELAGKRLLALLARQGCVVPPGREEEAELFVRVWVAVLSWTAPTHRERSLPEAGALKCGTCASRDGRYSAHLRWEANHFRVDEGSAALFLRLSRLDHSCAPNAVLVQVPDAGFRLVALRDVRRGEAL